MPVKQGGGSRGIETMILLFNPDGSKTYYVTSLVTTLMAILLPPPPKCNHALTCLPLKLTLKRDIQKFQIHTFAAELFGGGRL